MDIEFFATRIESIRTAWPSINSPSQHLAIAAEVPEWQARGLVVQILGNVTAATAAAWLKEICPDILEEEYERGREDGQHEGN